MLARGQPPTLSHYRLWLGADSLLGVSPKRPILVEAYSLNVFGDWVLPGKRLPSKLRTSLEPLLLLGYQKAEARNVLLAQSRRMNPFLIQKQECRSIEHSISPFNDDEPRDT